MKILFVTNDFPPIVGGVSNYYHNICAHFGDQDISVLTVYPPHMTDYDTAALFKIHRRRVPLGSNPVSRIIQLFLFFIYSFSIIKKDKIDLVFIGHLNLAPIGVYLHALLHIPYIIFLHGGELEKYLKIGFIKSYIVNALNKARLLVFNSDYTKARYSAMGMTIRDSLVLNPAVSTEWLDKTFDSRALIEKYGLLNHKVILTLGRLVERKGHDMVIKALPIIKKSIPRIKYVIAGKGPREVYLKNLTKELHLEDTVIFTGYIEDKDIPYFYSLCDLFIMPSREIPERDGVEGFGIVYLEANIFGKPVIGADTGGIADAVIHKQTGLLVNPLDERAIASAVITLLTDESYAHELGLNGKNRIKTTFNWDIQIQKLKVKVESLS